jgi:hypothetical protein
MIVSIVGRTCYVYRQDSDPVFRPTNGVSSWSAPGWYGAESRLLYHVQKTLNQRGYDLIKKRMWKDGHMVGTEHTQYLRSRAILSTPSLCIYHANHAVEIAAEVFAKIGMVELAVEYGLAEECDGPATAASRDHIMAIEARCSCFEVSWDAPAVLESGMMTSGPERYRHYNGFTDPTRAVAWFRSCPGQYPKVIDRRTGELHTL